MIISVLCLLVRCLLGCLTVLTRHRVSRDAELLVLRHENAVVRRQAGRIRYKPALMDLGQRASAVKFLIRDRAGQFTGSFDAVFTAEGTRIVASPPQAPRANAICEQVIGNLRREFPDRLLIVNEQHLHRVLAEYLTHYNTARPHREQCLRPVDGRGRGVPSR